MDEEDQEQLCVAWVREAAKMVAVQQPGQPGVWRLQPFAPINGVDVGIHSLYDVKHNDFNGLHQPQPMDLFGPALGVLLYCKMQRDGSNLALETAGFLGSLAATAPPDAQTFVVHGMVWVSTFGPCAGSGANKSTPVHVPGRR